MSFFYKNKFFLLVIAGAVFLFIKAGPFFLEKKDRPEGLILSENMAEPVGVRQGLYSVEESREDKGEDDLKKKEDLYNAFIEKYDGYEVLTVFSSLPQRFNKVSDSFEHLREIEEWVRANYKEKEAEAFLALYSLYLESEIALSDYITLQDMPYEKEKILVFLDEVYDLRKSYLGEKEANWLFEKENYLNLYRIERSFIVKDKTMMAAEKLRALKDLDLNYAEKEDLFALIPLKNSYQLYREMLDIHALDLDYLVSEEESSEYLKDLRREVFSEEVIERLEALERDIQSDREREALYKRERSKLLNSSLSPEEEERELDYLQRKYFNKEEAEALRRRELIRKADTKR